MRLARFNVICLTGLLAACSPKVPPAAPPAHSADDGVLQIIDAHTHTRFTGEPQSISKIPNTIDEYRKEREKYRVVGAVSHTKQKGEGYQPELAAEGVIFCGGVDAIVDEARLEQGLANGTYRCLKIYLGYVHQWASDPHYEPAYKLAEKYHVPVVFHTGDTDDVDAEVKYADPLTIDSIAVAHRGVTFVIAHCGNPWIESAAEVAYKNPNVYLDGSAFLIGNLANRTTAYVDKMMVSPLSWVFDYVDDPTKLMFGSDWPLVDMGQYIEAFKRAIPKEHWRAVFHDNAVRVFHLDQSRK